MKGSRIILGCVVFILSVPILFTLAVVLFYTEENWRGPHTWAVTKAELQSKGETVDYTALIPPIVPDDQNLGALPLFRLEPDPADKGILKPLNLQHALENISSNDYHLPAITRMFAGKQSDLDAISTSLSQRYRTIFKPPFDTAEPSALAELDALCPAMTEVRDAARTRPFCRFPQVYISMPPYERPLGLSTKLIALGQALTLHAVLSLHTNRSDLALDDMKTLFKLDAEMRREPELVSGLVASGIMQIQIGAIWEGITTHAWTDEQLAELDDMLKRVEFFSTYQLCIRSEAIGYFVPEMEVLKHHLDTTEIIGMADAQAKSNPILDFVVWLIPRGWFDIGKTNAVRLYYQAANQCADPQTHRFYPEKSDNIIESARAHTPYTVDELLLQVAMGPILDSCSTFAMVQAEVDDAHIACLAERYRLAHGAYPKSLSELASASEQLPRDIVNGEPYHYVLEPNGSLLIYSVGWDLIDEGGIRAYSPDDNKYDRKHGDWPWPALAPVEGHP